MAKQSKYSQRQLVEHVIHHCDLIQSYTEGVSEQEFLKNQMLVDAVTLNIQGIGEACTKIDDEIKETRDLPWKAIIGIRQIISHDYFGISPSIIWATAVNNIGELRAAFERTLEEMTRTEKDKEKEQDRGR